MTDATKLMLQRQMGARLRQVREAKGMTQAQFAQNIGVGTTTIAGWETGRNMLDAVALAKLATEHNFSADFVILGRIGTLPHELAVKVQALQFREAQAPSPTAPPRAARRLSGLPKPTHRATTRLQEDQQPFGTDDKNT